MNTMASSPHFLSKHIFPCDVDGHMILLELRHDKYSRLGDAEADALRHLFDEQNSPNAPAPPDFDLAIDVLVQQGILTKCPADGMDTFPAPPRQATLDMKGYPFDGNPRIRISHFLNCLRAFLRAKFMRRFYPIERVVGRIKNRREGRLAKADRKPRTMSDAELNRIRELVEIFRILKVLFYTAKGHCLFDSLTLVEFLAIYRVYPAWVFGVRMGPFGAHCWVQDDTHVYNDSVDNIDFYKPVMGV